MLANSNVAVFGTSRIVKWDHINWREITYTYMYCRVKIFLLQNWYLSLLYLLHFLLGIFRPFTVTELSRYWLNTDSVKTAWHIVKGNGALSHLWTEWTCISDLLGADYHKQHSAFCTQLFLHSKLHVFKIRTHKNKEALVKKQKLEQIT